MALYYTTNGNAPKCLYNGDDALIETMGDVALSVTEIQADGDELLAIQRQFSGIPMCNRQVVSWTGADAVFIARHFR